jgi:hypothetical protein
MTPVGGKTDPHLDAAGGERAARRWPAPPWRSGAGGAGHWGRRATGILREHWLVSVLLAAGLALRALTQFAYQPALIYIDTNKYLYGEYPGSDPLGYRAILKLILPVGDLGTVAAIQHLAGLAMAIALYAVLRRRGAARWLAALAVAPLLLDAYQLHMEQMIMPDVWFEAAVVAGLAVLLWRPAVTWPAVVAAGLIIGASATIRQVGEILILPAVLYLMAAGGGWRRVIGQSAALAVAFLLPILGYCGISYASTGHFWLSAGQPNVGRMAAAADCASLRLPPAARPLCPTPSQQARGPDWLEHSGHSPLHVNFVPPGRSRRRLIAVLGSAVVHQQPGRVVVSILRDSVRLFALSRAPVQGVTPISRWQFQARYPVYPPAVTIGRGNAIIIGLQRRAYGLFRFSKLSPAYGGNAQVNRPAAAFLRAYQLDGGYAPGPLLALFTLAGAAGSALALMRRRAAGRRQLALACLLFTGTAAVILLASDLFEFSWRYQLPALVTLPPAGMLGIGAILAQLQARRRAKGEPMAARPGPSSTQ